MSATTAPAGPPGLRAYPPAARRAAIACALGMAFSPAALVSITTFIVGPVSADYGWTQSEVLTVMALPVIVAPLVLPLAGRWVDRWGARPVAVPATLLYALATMAVVLTGKSQLQLGLALLASAVGGYIASMGVLYKVVSVWFTGHRGAALSIIIGGSAALSSAILAPLSQVPVRSVGWKNTYLILGLGILLLSLPAQAFLLSEPVTHDAQATAGALTAVERRDAERLARESLPGVSLGQAIRTRAFVITLVAMAVGAAAVLSIRQNAASLFGEHGYSGGTVAASLSVLFVSSVIGQVGVGVVLDRSRSPRVILPFIAAPFVALLILSVAHGVVAALFAGMFLLGLASGSEQTIGPFLLGRYFGLRAFAQIQGLTLGIVAIFLGMAPVAFSASREQSHSYTGGMIALMVLILLSGALVAMLPPYRREEQAVPATAASGPAVERA